MASQGGKTDTDQQEDMLMALSTLLGADDLIGGLADDVTIGAFTVETDSVSLDLPVTGIGPLSLSDTLNALGLGDGFGDLVSLVPLQDGLYLTALEFYGGLPLDGAAMFVSVEWPQASWSPLPGIEFHAPSLVLNAGYGNLSGTVSGIISFAGIDLRASLSFPHRDGSANLAPGETIGLAPLLDHFQMSPHGLEHLEISSMNLELDLGSGARSFDIGVDGVWDAGNFEITDLGLRLEHDGDPDSCIMAVLDGHARIELEDEDAIRIAVSASHNGPDAGWQLSGRVAFGDDGLSAGKMMEKVGVALPQTLDRMKLTTFAFTCDTKTKDVTLHLSGKFDTGHEDPPTVTVAAAMVHADGQPTRTTLSGHLRMAHMDFDLVFAPDPEASHFVAMYRSENGEKLSLGTLLRAASPSVASSVGLSGGMDGPSITLNDMLLICESGDKASSDPKAQKMRYVFALDADFGIDLSGLSKLPIVGSAMPASQALSIAVEPIIASDPIPDMDAVRPLLPDHAPFLPDDIGSGFDALITVNIGDKPYKLNLGFGDNPVPDDIRVASQPSTPMPPPAPEDPIHWIELNKHFGPLAIDRIGLGLLPPSGGGGPKIAARIDAALGVGPLTISLDGLGADIDVKSRHVDFALTGIGLMFKQEALEVSGEFMKLGPGFVGRALVEMEELSLGALGAYEELDGHPSFFAYAFLNDPLGGPVFFFVEGLAFGFGYNRQLIMPDVRTLHSFPLVAEVMGSDPPKGGLRAEMQSLQRYVPARLDEYFLAIGIKFNSFKVLDGVTLLAVSFGQHLEFDLIGETTLQLPPKEADAPITLAKLIIPFSAKYLPDEGFLAVNAEIAPGSFVYCPAVKLQGSMAFYSWFKGRHAGDFVFTIGGYHPDFKVPAHYPQRGALKLLGFDWEIDSHFTVKGGLYYAMTPACAMAGGRLEAQFHAGPLRANFDLGLDLLIQWQPYHYTARAHVEIGASLVIDVPLIGSLRVSISASAKLELWGPELAGKAHVSTGVMGVSVHFDVSVGSTKKGDVPAISWTAFETAFLPSRDAVCNIAVTGGLVRTVKGDTGEIRVVNQKEFALRTGSLIPSFRISKTVQTTSGLTAPFGTGPMKQALEANDALHLVTANRKGDDGNFEACDMEFRLRPYTKSYPLALWGIDPRPNQTLNGGAIDAIGGCDVLPAVPPAPGASSRIEREALDYVVTPRDLPQSDVPKMSERLTPLSANWRETLASAVTKKATVERRMQMLTALGFKPEDVSGSTQFIDDIVVPPAHIHRR